MYDRTDHGKPLTFEPSGGLLHSALVMQDRESNTYWSIVTGSAIAGARKGTPLVELPVGEKRPWKAWVKQHPDTLVLSIDGVEDLPTDPYAGYFTSPEGFRHTRARDDRLPTKAPIFAFTHGGRRYAVPFDAFEGGRAFGIGETTIFLYRPKGAAIFYDTKAYAGKDAHFERVGNRWVERRSGCTFDPAGGGFTGGKAPCPEPHTGFDTFWYIWSLTHPDTELLR